MAAVSERCELSDLPTDQCACRVHGPCEDRPEPSRSGVAVAGYDGECLECHGEIRAEVDVLVFSSRSGWIHEECR